MSSSWNPWSSGWTLPTTQPHGTPRGSATNRNRRKAAKRRANRHHGREVHNGVVVHVTPSTRAFPGFG